MRLTPNNGVQRMSLRATADAESFGVKRHGRWRGGLRQGMAIAIVTVWTCACVRSTQVTVQPDGSSQELALRRTWAGILLGPCITPYPGKTQENYWIQLKGPGPSYSSQEVEFVDAQGHSVGQGKLEGEIRLEPGRKRVFVNLRLRGEPFSLNGSYRYKESS